MSFVPGLGIFKGLARTFRNTLRQRETVQYPEVVQPISPRHRGRLVLLYDEAGALKCETCFQCAQACPIECIDMGGVDTKNRFHVHWGPAEQYAERREESALRRAGRPVPDPTFAAFEPLDTAPLESILRDEDYDPRHMLRILARTQEVYGHLPVAALKHISHATGAWYSEVYGTATFYDNLRLAPPSGHVLAVCRCPSCAFRGAGRVLASLEGALATTIGQASPEGAVRLEAADCHGASPEGVFLTLDGAPQARVTPKDAAELAARLRAAHTPGGRA
ncbi:MAG: NAD(P)H-dependent oxidoreductase subunit E [Candidatus Limnocylindrales bacterium]